MILKEKLALVGALLRETDGHRALAVAPVVRERERGAGERAGYRLGVHAEYRVEHVVRGDHVAHIVQTQSLRAAPS